MAPPAKVIDEVEVERYRRLHFGWHQIAIMLGVHRNTLTNWRKEVGFADPMQTLTDEALDEIIMEHKQENRGEKTTEGYLRSMGYKITRNALRKSINRVDLAGRQLRKQKAVKRREYQVEGPHHLWHIDGHHKLIKYGLVTHGCIDGFSRTVIYLRCTNNNNASTTLSLFKRGVTEYMLPSRVRGDKGGENVLIADLMISHRGENRGSFIAGQSKHNVRIERLWRDMRTNTIDFYKQLFMNLEGEGLDVDNTLHLYVLQYMFLTRINQDLDGFKESWNHHSLRTEHNHTPYQLLTMNRATFPDEVEVNLEVVNEVVGEENEIIPYVHIDPVKCPLSDEQEIYFMQHCLPLTMNDPSNTLVDRFACALSFAMEVSINF